MNHLCFLALSNFVSEGWSYVHSLFVFSLSSFCKITDKGSLLFDILSVFVANNLSSQLPCVTGYSGWHKGYNLFYSS